VRTGRGMASSTNPIPSSTSNVRSWFCVHNLHCALTAWFSRLELRVADFSDSSPEAKKVFDSWEGSAQNLFTTLGQAEMKIVLKRMVMLSARPQVRTHFSMLADSHWFA
jgi:hypothetical protein